MRFEIYHFSPIIKFFYLSYFGITCRVPYQSLVDHSQGMIREKLFLNITVTGNLRFRLIKTPGISLNILEISIFDRGRNQRLETRLTTMLTQCLRDISAKIVQIGNKESLGNCRKIFRKI